MTDTRLGAGRRRGWVVVLAGAGLALAVQLAAPVGVPLYDGVPVFEPYRYLHPAGNQQGSPTSFASDEEVTDGVSPVFAAATAESPPQAQLIAQRDAFLVGPAATSLHITIAPVDPEVQPTAGSIAGNVYRFRVTDQDGNAVPTKACEGCLSIVLRAPEGAEEGVIDRYADGAWAAVATLHAGVAAMYQANLTSLGEFAIVTATAPGSELDLTLVLAGLGIALIFAAFVGLMFIRARPPSAYPSPSGRRGRRGRIPAKHRGPRRPNGRSNS